VEWRRFSYEARRRKRRRHFIESLPIIVIVVVYIVVFPPSRHVDGHLGHDRRRDVPPSSTNARNYREFDVRIARIVQVPCQGDPLAIALHNDPFLYNDPTPAPGAWSSSLRPPYLAFVRDADAPYPLSGRTRPLIPPLSSLMASEDGRLVLFGDFVWRGRLVPTHKKKNQKIKKKNRYFIGIL
jgi:hypothetical protein